MLTGTGDYSCVQCGMVTTEPCEHWKMFHDAGYTFETIGERAEPQTIPYDKKYMVIAIKKWHLIAAALLGLLLGIGLAIAHGQVIPTGVILTWQWAGTGTPTYSVYRATVSGGETQPPLASGLAAMTYTDTTAVVGTKYYYTFTATVGGVQSDPSPEVAAQITMPTPPTNPATAVY